MHIGICPCKVYECHRNVSKILSLRYILWTHYSEVLKYLVVVDTKPGTLVFKFPIDRVQDLFILCNKIPVYNFNAIKTTFPL